MDASVSVTLFQTYGTLRIDGNRQTCDSREIELVAVISLGKIQIMRHLLQNEQMSDEEQLSVQC